MDFELDFSSENSTMTSFLELEQEIREAPLLSEPLVRPSVIVKPRHKPTVQPSLSDIMDSCGIEYDLPGDCNANISSPSSIHSDVQLEQNRELIDELEEFFINTDGKPTVVDDCEELILDDQYSPAAFRYREKKKSELDLAEEELEALADKNTCLKEKLTEMETEFKYLKKLMVEAGLGKYTMAVNY